MTSSRDVASMDALPPALSSMWRLCKLGYRHEPALIVTAFAIALLAAVPDALLALWFKLIGEGFLEGDWGRVRLGMLAIGLSATATWFLATVSTRVFDATVRSTDTVISGLRNAGGAGTRTLTSMLPR